MQLISDEVERLDIYISKILNKPRNQILPLIKEGHVQIGQNIVKKAGHKLKIGDEISLSFPQAKEEIIKNVDFDLSILYEDEEMLIINKPPFLVVHEAPSVKEATVVDWLKSRGIKLSTIAGKERYGIVHRIDKETSGALVIAKTNEAHLSLSKQLEKKTMGRYYLALIDLPLKNDCFVNEPISRNPKNRLKMGIVKGGKEAKSAFVKLIHNEDLRMELIGAKLYSGRTHQIRVHLEYLSRHILGDTLYGFKSQKVKIPRVMLHAFGLYLTHPRTNEKIMVMAPLIEDFEGMLFKFFNKEILNEEVNINNIIKRFNDLDGGLCGN